MLSLMGNMSENEGSVENEIAWRQFATESSDSNSWFIVLVRLAELYELSSPHYLIAHKTNKKTWRKLVTLNDKLRADARLSATTRVLIKQGVALSRFKHTPLDHS